MNEQAYWRRCGPCKNPIAYGATFYTCSVSTCRKMTFCSRDCWSAHVPIMRHKDAWHEEAKAPLSEDIDPAVAELAEGLRRKRIAASSGTSLPVEEEVLPQDVLVVASKLKQYIKARGQMNTSAPVFDRLSDIVRHYCDAAISRAREDGRKTVLDRDFHF